MKKSIIRQVCGEKVRFCSEGCEEGFRTDRRVGLIYPQYEIKGKRMGVEKASIKGFFCAYCSESL